MKYERMTKRDEHFGVIALCNSCEHRLNGTCTVDDDDSGHSCIGAIKNRLAELEDKIENKTLIELPCEVGDKFYGIVNDTIFKYTVLAIKLVREHKIVLCTVYDIEFILGEDAFLTEAEAKEKTAKVKGERR